MSHKSQRAPGSHQSASFRELTAAWMGHSNFEARILADRIQLTGHELMARSLTRWLIRWNYGGLPEPEESLHRASWASARPVAAPIGAVPYRP